MVYRYCVRCNKIFFRDESNIHCPLCYFPTDRVVHNNKQQQRPPPPAVNSISFDTRGGGGDYHHLVRHGDGSICRYIRPVSVVSEGHIR
jgi:hypothetical protein